MGRYVCLPLQIATSLYFQSLVSLKAIGHTSFWCTILIGHLTPQYVSLLRTLRIIIYSYSYPGLFIDGVLNDVLNWTYPKPDNIPQVGKYILGDDSKVQAGWCMASSYFVSVPLGKQFGIAAL